MLGRRNGRDRGGRGGGRGRRIVKTIDEHPNKVTVSDITVVGKVFDERRNANDIESLCKFQFIQTTILGNPKKQTVVRCRPDPVHLAFIITRSRAAGLLSEKQYFQHFLENIQQFVLGCFHFIDFFFPFFYVLYSHVTFLNMIVEKKEEGREWGGEERRWEREEKKYLKEEVVTLKAGVKI